jgi:hypothetical protein
MVPVAFFLLAHAFQTQGTASRECIFLPWIVFVLVYMLCAIHRKTDVLCTDTLKIGIFITSVAMLFVHKRELAYACSLCSLIKCAWELAIDVYSTCAFGISAVIALPMLCPLAITVDTQLKAIVLTEFFQIIYFFVKRLV